MKHKNKIIILLSITSFLFSKIHTHQINLEEKDKIKEARSLSRNGMIKESENIYYDLFKKNPSLKEALAPLKEILKKNNNLSRLTEISNIYLKYFNNNLNAKIEIIDALIIIDHPEWEKIVYTISTNINIKDKIIKKTLKILLDNNKINEVKKAITLLRNTKSKDYYSYEMGSYYALNFSIEESIKEYLLYLESNPKKYFVISNRILAFPDFEQLNNKIQLLLEKNQSYLSKMILSDLKFREKKFRESYEILKKFSNDDSNLINFAENLINNKEYDLAQIVINDVLNSSSDKIAIQQAIIILAELFESLIVSEKDILPISNSINYNNLLDSPFIKVDSEKIHLLQNAIYIYDSLRINIKDIKSTYQLAEIKYKILGDLDGANQLYYEIINNKKNKSNYKTQSIIKIIDILITKGNLELAKETIEKFKPEINNEELYAIKNIQILFYLNNWNELNIYSTSFLKKDTKKNQYYNDILNISSNILLFEEDIESLNSYVKSRLKLFQNKRMESIEILNSIDQLGNTEIKSKIKYDLSRLYLKQEEYQKAINILNTIDTESAYIESAYLLKAEIYDYLLNNKSKAVDFYLYILEEFPHSIHHEAIRLRLRELTS